MSHSIGGKVRKVPKKCYILIEWPLTTTTTKKNNNNNSWDARKGWQSEQEGQKDFFLQYKGSYVGPYVTIFFPASESSIFSIFSTFSTAITILGCERLHDGGSDLKAAELTSAQKPELAYPGLLCTLRRRVSHKKSNFGTPLKPLVINQILFAYLFICLKHWCVGGKDFPRSTLVQEQIIFKKCFNRTKFILNSLHLPLFRLKIKVEKS